MIYFTHKKFFGASSHIYSWTCYRIPKLLLFLEHHHIEIVNIVLTWFFLVCALVGTIHTQYNVLDIYK
jgi:hypothetical protein